jgi:hypothetical protein
MSAHHVLVRGAWSLRPTPDRRGSSSSRPPRVVHAHLRRQLPAGLVTATSTTGPMTPTDAPATRIGRRRRCSSSRVPRITAPSWRLPLVPVSHSCPRCFLLPITLREGASGPDGRKTEVSWTARNVPCSTVVAVQQLCECRFQGDSLEYSSRNASQIPRFARCQTVVATDPARTAPVTRPNVPAPRGSPSCPHIPG